MQTLYIDLVSRCLLVREDILTWGEALEEVLRMSELLHHHRHRYLEEEALRM